MTNLPQALNADDTAVLILTHAAKRGTDDRCHQICRCAGCSFTAECTMFCDFYGEKGQPLLCESCLRSEAKRVEFWGVPKRRRLGGKAKLARVETPTVAATSWIDMLATIPHPEGSYVH